MKKEKILLLLLLLFCFCISISAQLTLHNAPSKGAMHKAHINPSAGQAWWGYFFDDGYYGDFGTETTSTYNCAIFIPGDHELAKESKIYAERLWMIRDVDNISGIKIWLSKQLPTTADEADVVCKDVTTSKGGIVDFAFDEPYTLDSDGIYVGYSFTVDVAESDEEKWPVQTTYGLTPVEHALYIKVPGVLNKWYSNFDLTNSFGGNWGNLAMQVLLGDGFFNNAARIKEVGSSVVALGETSDVAITIQNLGGEMLEEFSYTVTNNGVESEEINFPTGDSPIENLLGEMAYKIPLPAAAQPGESVSTVKITKVNGVENELNDGTEKFDVKLVTVAERPVRRTVMENFVETTNGFSPLAIVSNDRLGRDWHNELANPTECEVDHNNYIGIMIHDRDAMETSTYINTLLELDEYQAKTQSPWIFSRIDRQQLVLAYYGSQYDNQYTRRTKFGIEDDFLASQKQTVEAGIDITADWKNADHSMIKATVCTTFQYSTEDVHYALAFVLTEDGVHGDDASWNLVNNVLPQTKLSEVFLWDTYLWENFVCGPTSIDNMVYNDVVVGGDEVYEGVKSSVRNPIVQGQTQSYIRNIDLTYYNNIQNRDNLNVIVLLLDTRSGRIVNAARQRVGASAGINDIPISAPSTPTYDLQGRRVADSYQGLVIKNGRKYINK